jgi:hypothetical protein
VLVTAGPPEFVYLVDFGIARGVQTDAQGRLTDTGAAIGTWEYMAPEVKATDCNSFARCCRVRCGLSRSRIRCSGCCWRRTGSSG